LGPILTVENSRLDHKSTFNNMPEPTVLDLTHSDDDSDGSLFIIDLVSSDDDTDASEDSVLVSEDYKNIYLPVPPPPHILRHSNSMYTNFEW